MKHIIFLFIVSIFLIAACQQKKTETDQKTAEDSTLTLDTTDIETQSVTIAEDQSFYLKYKFIPGESFRYRMTVTSQNEQSIQADTSMTMFMNQTLSYTINFKTLSLSKDSVAELQCTFTSINVNANINGTPVSYQSGAVIDSSEKAKFAEYESLLNNPFNLKVRQNGEVKDVSKTEKIMNRFLSLRGLSDSLNAQDKVTFNADMVARSIKPLIFQILREVPENELTKDSTWSFDRESMPVMVFQVDFTNEYKIEGLEMLGSDRIAVVGGIVKTNVTGNQTFNDKGINYEFDKPVTSASGKIYFNIDRGLIQRSRTQTRMENTYRMEMPTPEGTKKGSAREVNSNTNVLELL